ncbi:MAG: hypothetical protein AABX19_01505 [Nanoarchaeota archaeon]
MDYDQEVNIACTSCSKKVPISQATYGTGKSLICFSCYNLIARGAKPDRIIQSAEAPEKVNYKCNNCGYNFSRSVNFHFGGACFNCGKYAVEVMKSNEVIMKDRKSLLDY